MQFIKDVEKLVLEGNKIKQGLIIKNSLINEINTALYNSTDIINDMMYFDAVQAQIIDICNCNEAEILKLIDTNKIMWDIDFIEVFLNDVFKFETIQDTLNISEYL